MVLTVPKFSDEISSDGNKLRLLADWHDARDRQSGNTNVELQQDLRRMAERLDALDEFTEKWQAVFNSWRKYGFRTRS